MCECGCSYDGPDYVFKGPKSLYYGIRIYGGCKDCDAPVGVDIAAITAGDDVFGKVSDYPALEFFGNSMASLAVMDADCLIKELHKIGIEIDMDAYSEGDISEAMRGAVYRTIRKYDDAKKANSVAAKKRSIKR